MPKDADAPDDISFVDRLNLWQIFEGTHVNFSINDYRDLFEDSDTLFVDIEQNRFSAQRFISRLRSINRDVSIECGWEIPVGGEYISMDRPTTLNARYFRVTSLNSAQEFTGEVRITVRHTAARWLITEWRELDETHSFFHPSLGGNFDN